MAMGEKCHVNVLPILFMEKGLCDIVNCIWRIYKKQRGATCLNKWAGWHLKGNEEISSLILRLLLFDWK